MNWIGTYIRLLRQWKGMPTSMQQTLLGVIRTEVVRICKKYHRSQQVRCVQETAYAVDEAELQLYAEQLRMDLEKAVEEDLVPGWEDGDSTTKPDDNENEEDATRIESGDERDRQDRSFEDDEGEDGDDTEDGEGDEEEDNEE